MTEVAALWDWAWAHTWWSVLIVLGGAFVYGMMTPHKLTR
jgi:hypothetical protein